MEWYYAIRKCLAFLFCGAARYYYLGWRKERTHKVSPRCFSDSFFVSVSLRTYFNYTAECLELQKRVAEHCAPQPSTALELLQSTQQQQQQQQPNNLPEQQQQQNVNAEAVVKIMRHLPTGLTVLDHIIKGGIRVGTLTELVGKAGSGKTQLAMQTAVCAALLHRAGTIYVDTEQKLSLTRLQEIAIQQRSLQRRQQQQQQLEDVVTQPATVLENLTVHTPNSMAELETTLASLEEEIFLRNSSEHHFPVRLLVVDSIAAPAQRDMVSNAQRAIAVMQCAQRLKRLADQFQVAVLIINQVGSTTHSSSSSSINAATGSTFAKDRAALGTAWHHCVTTRIQLEQHSFTTTTATDDNLGAPVSGRTTSRTASVVKSNTVPAGTVSFSITNSGLVGI